MDRLPRRAFLGLLVREDRGLTVTRVLEGSMGERAELRAGDVVESLDGEPLASVAALVQKLRGATGSVRLGFRRGDRKHEVIVPVVPMPTEHVAGCEVRYGHVAARGARLRTITIDARGPAIVFMQGIRCQSIDLALQPDAPIVRLVHGLAAAGVSSIRMDRPGVGDSEGGPCEAIDFATELEAYAALLDFARASFDQVVLFGHSVGGVIAPLLAVRGGVAGVVVYGTSAERWSAALRQGFARQWRLHGLGADTIAARLARFDANPFEDRHGRSLAFHEGIERADAASAWAGVRAPVSIMIGEHDWVVGEEAQRAITAHVPHAEVHFFDGLDHAFTRHPSQDESLRRYGAGTFDGRLVDEVARFVRSLP